MADPRSTMTEEQLFALNQNVGDPPKNAYWFSKRLEELLDLLQRGASAGLTPTQLGLPTDIEGLREQFINEPAQVIQGKIGNWKRDLPSLTQGAVPTPGETEGIHNRYRDLSPEERQDVITGAGVPEPTRMEYPEKFRPVADPIYTTQSLPGQAAGDVTPVQTGYQSDYDSGASRLGEVDNPDPTLGSGAAGDTGVNPNVYNPGRGQAQQDLDVGASNEWIRAAIEGALSNAGILPGNPSRPTAMNRAYEAVNLAQINQALNPGVRATIPDALGATFGSGGGMPTVDWARLAGPSAGSEATGWAGERPQEVYRGMVSSSPMGGQAGSDFYNWVQRNAYAPARSNFLQGLASGNIVGGPGDDFTRYLMGYLSGGGTPIPIPDPSTSIPDPSTPIPSIPDPIPSFPDIPGLIPEEEGYR